MLVPADPAVPCCALCLVQVRSICEEMGIAFLGVGFDPKWRNEDVPRMPKSRWVGCGQQWVGEPSCLLSERAGEQGVGG